MTAAQSDATESMTEPPFYLSSLPLVFLTQKQYCAAIKSTLQSLFIPSMTEQQLAIRPLGPST